jgi:hypothetical protein
LGAPRVKEVDQHPEECHGQAFLEIMRGIQGLHAAHDAALGGRGEAALAALGPFAERLSAADRQMGLLREAFDVTRDWLARAEAADPGCLPIVRDDRLRTMDYDDVYAQLLAGGAALPGRVYWDELAVALRDGGVRGGMAIVERALGEARQALSAALLASAALAERSLPELEPGIAALFHHIGAIMTRWTRFHTQMSYLGVLSESTAAAVRAQM